MRNHMKKVITILALLVITEAATAQMQNAANPPPSIGQGSIIVHYPQFSWMAPYCKPDEYPNSYLCTASPPMDHISEAPGSQLNRVAGKILVCPVIQSGGAGGVLLELDCTWVGGEQ